ncbi:BfmA/BtgA family mobilization protein [Empedobacter brevis]|uniref:BfmA/BtgA family mobilization protein n=1 Tax=Empedobacter brevis TaxID=247 RepID=UPI00333F2489
MKTTIQIDKKLKEKIDTISAKYDRTTPNQTLEFILNYLERNDIDLNIELKNELYQNLKKFDKDLENKFKLVNNSTERIIKIIRRYEIDYFSKIAEINNEHLRENIYKNEIDISIVKDFFDKIIIEESQVTGQKKFILKVTDEEYMKFWEMIR